MVHSIIHRAKKLWGYLRSLGWRTLTLGGAAIVVLFIIVRMFFGSSAANIVEDSTPLVTLKTVSELSAMGSPISIAGTVSSQSEATVRAESAGSVTAVYRSLGQYVVAGTIVAELENSSERAAVMQAQGSVDAAQANVDRVAIGDTASKSTALSTILSAYAAVDSAVHGSADTMILNPDSSTAQFTVTSSDSQTVTKINATRPTLSALLSRESKRASTLSSGDDLLSELKQTQSEVRSVQVFIDLVITALNNAIATESTTQSDISADLASAAAARTALNTSYSAVTSAIATLTTTPSDVSAGQTSPELAAALAQLKQAQGALAAAKANLEKAIIRAPISGTINSFSLKRGDFVQQFSPVLTVANNGALEITAYATSQDLTNLTVGQKVGIEGGSTGIITHVAPAIDPVTKKIEVRVGVSENSNLVNGQSVLVNLPRKTVSTTLNKNTRITIPITALKVGATEIDVFTASTTESELATLGTLVPHPVVLGELLGDSVVVTEGLAPEMAIVVDARGLRAGQVVEISH